MISISDKSLCCGCGACEQACSTNCIEMRRDFEGFLYPNVNVSKCIDCALCDKVCPMFKEFNGSGVFEVPVAYGGWHKDENIRYDSSSGGAFTLLAEKIISKGGIVYGCTLNEEIHACHIGVETIENLSKLRGSKYVQSEITQTYHEVKKAVLEGRKVLFVGTPCQAAGLFSYMGNSSFENLYIVDFICHGVPSPSVFEAYIKDQEAKNGRKIVSHRFRNKDRGWSQTGLQLGSKSNFVDGTSKRRYPAFMDSYMNGFLDDVYLRPSCYDCKFKSIPKSYADFTIADFWGVDKVSSELNDEKGTSLVLINTKNGELLWSEVKDKFYHKEVDFENAVKRNKPLVESAKKNANREDFFSNFEKRGFKYVERKYMTAFTWAWHKICKIIFKGQ